MNQQPTLAPKWRRVETYLAAAVVGLAAFISTPYAKEVPAWAMSIALSLLPVLQLLAGDSTAGKALATPTPPQLPKAKMNGKGPLIVLLALLLPTLVWSRQILA